MAVRDHECFRLKLLFTQKKRVDCENSGLRQEKSKLLVSFPESQYCCRDHMVSELTPTINLVCSNHHLVADKNYRVK